MQQANISTLKDIVLPITTQFVGVLLAGLIAFWVARWQLNKQNNESKHKDADYLEELFGRVRIELRDNKNLVSQRLTEAVSGITNSYDEHWAYLASIVNSFRFTAYHMLIESGLVKNLPKEVQVAMGSGYDFLESLQRLILMGQSGQSYYKLIKKQDSAELLLKNAATYTRTVKQSVEHDFKIVADKDPYKKKGAA